MTKPKRLKTAAQAHTAQSRDEVAALIRQIGDTQRDLARRQAAMNDAIAAVTADHQPTIAAMNDAIARHQAAVQTWCEAHRDELTQGGKVKTANLVTGEVQWRQRPPSVRIIGADTVIDTLESLGLAACIRVNREINKEAILANPKAVAGVAGIHISQGVEDFVITPFEQTA
jgi:phage host-nuclease inhibitor protein Gam